MSEAVVEFLSVKRFHLPQNGENITEMGLAGRLR